MTCRSCSAKIADKAIVCYRCGTPTVDVVAPRAAPAGRGRGWIVFAMAAALALIAALFLLFRPPA